MSKYYARPINTSDLAHRFLTDALGLPHNDATGDAAQYISSAEIVIYSKQEQPTISSSANRHHMLKSDGERRLRRKEIFNQLLTMDRLVSDDDIDLGVGGAKPPGVMPTRGKQAFFVTGPPASGKSMVASKIADAYGAYILDSDYAKRKFPEFKFDYGADLVHEESSLVVWGSTDAKFADELCLFQYCVKEGYNIVIPKIGHTVESITTLKDYLTDIGYEVHLTLVSLDRVKSTTRALDRFVSTKRYVPLALIFDGYGNNPILSYYRLKKLSGWKSLGKVSTDVPRENPPVIVEAYGGNPASLFS